MQFSKMARRGGLVDYGKKRLVLVASVLALVASMVTLPVAEGTSRIFFQ